MLHDGFTEHYTYYKIYSNKLQIQIFITIQDYHDVRPFLITHLRTLSIIVIRLLAHQNFSMDSGHMLTSHLLTSSKRSRNEYVFS